MERIFSVGVVALFDAVHLEAQRIAVKADCGAVGLSHMERDKLGAKDVAHGLLCGGIRGRVVRRV